MFYDTSHNSHATVFETLRAAFRQTALKMWAYMRALGRSSRPRPDVVKRKSLFFLYSSLTESSCVFPLSFFLVLDLSPCVGSALWGRDKYPILPTIVYVSHMPLSITTPFSSLSVHLADLFALAMRIQNASLYSQAPHNQVRRSRPVMLWHTQPPTTPPPHPAAFPSCRTPPPLPCNALGAAFQPKRRAKRRAAVKAFFVKSSALGAALRLIHTLPIADATTSGRHHPCLHGTRNTNHAVLYTISRHCEDSRGFLPHPD